MLVSEQGLIPPYGGQLVDLVVHGAERQALIAAASHLPSLQISARALCDLELLATGGFSPLDRFMGQADYAAVLRTMRLANGMLWPMPITLTADPAQLPEIGGQVALRDARFQLVAVMDVAEIFSWDPAVEVELVLGTTDPRHPLVSEMIIWGKVCVSGRLQVIEIPRVFDFAELRRSPSQVRDELAKRATSAGSAARPFPVVAFQTRNPLHRAHEEMTKHAASQIDGILLLHPSVGMTKPGDVDHYSRVRIYKTLVEHYYDQQRTLLSLLPLAMRMAGPREAVWHAIIRRNHGASHFIVGRDHAGPGNDSNGKPFYGPYEAQELVATHAAELGVMPLFFQEIVYLEDSNTNADGMFLERDKVPPGAKILSISGTQVRDNYLARGRLLPAWFTRPETATILAEVYPSQHRRGFCIWFTGLSGAGKSTIAEILTVLLLERGRQATILDGDVVRTHLSKGLGFSKADRDTNILRIGFVAGEIIRHNGIVITAAVSPYRATRDECRKLVGSEAFFEVFVDTPIEVCEERDTKGLYAKARRGEVKNFTGIDDPYEPPIAPELHLYTVNTTPEANARAIITLLEARGFLGRE